MQALIEEMSALIVKIKSGTATQGELEAFAAAAGELNERAIILRYKSYEAKVFGTPAAPVAEPVAETKAEPEAIHNEPVAAEATVEHTATETETENAELSFDLFSMDEDDEPAAADMPFTPDSETSVPKEPISDEVMAHSEAHPVEPVSDDPNNAEDGIGAEEEMEAPIIHEAIPEVETTAEEPLFSYPEEEIEPAIEHIENESIAEAPTTQAENETPQSAPAKEETFSGDEHPVYKRLTNDDNSLAARLMAVRLETLKGAFGFNERLQIIRELFDGSNDEFTQAIEKLDALDSKNEARHVVSNYARQYAWDKDSNLALEFIQKVERRYA